MPKKQEIFLPDVKVKNSGRVCLSDLSGPGSYSNSLNVQFFKVTTSFYSFTIYKRIM